jgi:ABC-type branched-subunit amino acid transport system substrate-binding protein
MLRGTLIRFLAIALVVVGAALFRPTDAKSADEDWNFALLLPLTGPFAAWAEGVDFAVKWAVDETNAQGGIAGRQVKITNYDTALDPATAVARTNEALKKHTIIMGPWASGMVSSAMPAIQRANAFAFSVNSGEQALDRFKPHLINLWTYFPTAVEQTLQGYVGQNPDVKSLAVIYNPMDEFWVRFANFQKDAGESLGLKVHPLIEIGQGVTASAAVTKALGYDADAFAVTGLNQDMIDSLLELNRRGVTENRRLLFYPLADDAAFREVGGDAVVGTFVWNVYNTLSDNARWQAFQDDYRKAHGGLDPGLASIPYIDAVAFIERAIEDNGLTGDPAKRAEEWEKLIAYMGNTEDFGGVTQEFDLIDYQMHGPSFLMKYEAGPELMLVETYASPGAK